MGSSSWRAVTAGCSWTGKKNICGMRAAQHECSGCMHRGNGRVDLCLPVLPPPCPRTPTPLPRLPSFLSLPPRWAQALRFHATMEALAACTLDLELVSEERCTGEQAVLYPANAVRNRALRMARTEVGRGRRRGCSAAQPRAGCAGQGCTPHFCLLWAASKPQDRPLSGLPCDGCPLMTALRPARPFGTCISAWHLRAAPAAPSGGAPPGRGFRSQQQPGADCFGSLPVRGPHGRPVPPLRHSPTGL